MWPQGHVLGVWLALQVLAVFYVSGPASHYIIQGSHTATPPLLIQGVWSAVVMAETGVILAIGVAAVTHAFLLFGNTLPHLSSCGCTLQQGVERAVVVVLGVALGLDLDLVRAYDAHILDHDLVAAFGLGPVWRRRVRLGLSSRAWIGVASLFAWITTASFLASWLCRIRCRIPTPSLILPRWSVVLATCVALCSILLTSSVVFSPSTLSSTPYLTPHLPPLSHVPFATALSTTSKGSLLHELFARTPLHFLLGLSGSSPSSLHPNHRLEEGGELHNPPYLSHFWVIANTFGGCLGTFILISMVGWTPILSWVVPLLAFPTPPWSSASSSTWIMGHLWSLLWESCGGANGVGYVVAPLASISVFLFLGIWGWATQSWKGYGRKLQPTQFSVVSNPWSTCSVIGTNLFLLALTTWGVVYGSQQQWCSSFQIPFGVDFEHGPRPPSNLRLAGELLGLVVVNEILFYPLHRAFHTFPLLADLHAWHHSFAAPFTILSIYAHPIEMVVVNLFPLTVGMVLLHVTPYTALLWLIMASFATCVHHSGRVWPWLPQFETQPGYHDLHHARGDGNYGSSPVLDSLFGTLILHQSSS